MKHIKALLEMHPFPWRAVPGRNEAENEVTLFDGNDKEICWYDSGTSYLGYAMLDLETLYNAYMGELLSNEEQDTEDCP